jgi:NADPH-ferrihemoprotein reductase
MEAPAHGFEATVVSASDITPESLASLPAAVLIFSCYGEGEPTDNAKKFYSGVMAKSSSTELSQLKYAVFGLGNSQCFPARYNVVGKHLDAKLAALGATRVAAMGLGDASGTLEEDFATWQKGLWEHLSQAAPQISSQQPSTSPKQEEKVEQQSLAINHVPSTTSPAPQTHQPQPQTRIPLMVGDTSFRLLTQRQVNLVPPDATLAIAPVVATRELFAQPDAFQSAKEVTFDLSGAPSPSFPVNYVTGDHIGVFGHNAASAVQRFADAFRIEDLDEVVALKSSHHPSTTPTLTTLRQLCTFHIEVAAIPAPNVLKALRNLADAQGCASSAARLAQLASPAGYTEGIRLTGLDVCDVLQRVPDVRVPLPMLVDLLPALRPRYYSITSSAHESPARASVVSRLVAYTNGAGRRVEGLCSGFLNHVHVGDYAPVVVRPSTFRLPVDPSTPIICVAAGTGIAPYLGFLRERIHLVKRRGVAVGPAFLYYGCRHEAQLMCADVIEEALACGALSERHYCFSMADDMARRLMVHDKVAADAPRLAPYLQKEAGHIYICGGASGFGTAIRGVIDRMLGETGLGSVETLFAEKRYHEDLAD